VSYSATIKVRFGDVDPAGIVFYPRYFEMLNSAVEDWFEDFLGVSFSSLHLVSGLAVPTVRLDCDFAAPSRLGEVIEVTLSVLKLGRSSCSLSFAMSSGGAVRLSGTAVLVCTDLKSIRAVAWPPELRERLSRT
jgi:4-hydroxybenzoyl-CoA thioesterase